MSTLAKSKEEIRAEIQALEKQYKAAASSDFAEKSAKLFAEFPELKSFGWTQYTPYFNDGDTCRFSANTDDLRVNGFDEWDDDVESDEGALDLLTLANGRKWNGRDWVEKPEGADKRAVAIVKAVKQFLGEFDNDYFEGAFGDHKRVKVTAAGVETEEYEHD